MKSISSVMSRFNKVVTDLNTIAEKAEMKASRMAVNAEMVRDEIIKAATEQCATKREKASELFGTAHEAARIAQKITTLIS